MIQSVGALGSRLHRPHVARVPYGQCETVSIHAELAVCLLVHSQASPYERCFGTWFTSFPCHTSLQKLT